MPPRGTVGSSVEHDWSAARSAVFPVIRPPDSHGTPLTGLVGDRLVTEAVRGHGQPVIDDGPAGLIVAYAVALERYQVLVNAAHLQAWGISPETLRETAFENLGSWSAAASWTEEVDGGRRVRSSASGDGWDSSRILLPSVRTELAAELGSEPGVRVLCALPDRDLLIAVPLAPGDAEFALQFAAFAETATDEADIPVERRLFEIVDGQLREFRPTEG